LTVQKEVKDLIFRTASGTLLHRYQESEIDSIAFQIGVIYSRLYPNHFFLLTTMSSESPPAKRQRTDEDEPITRSDIWYEDGSVVLQARNTQFRVHWSVLAQHSSFFRDMQKLPQPPDQPNADGCPIVELQDDVADVEHLLRALYSSFVPPP
jgi:hypothetical protein